MGIIYTKKKLVGRKKGRVVTLDLPSGKKKKIRLHKNTPERCSEPRRICIVCLRSVIHKLDRNYESKVCKSCTFDQISGSV